MMSSKTYQCYKFTKDDKEWRKAGGKISKKFNRSEHDVYETYVNKILIGYMCIIDDNLLTIFVKKIQ